MSIAQHGKANIYFQCHKKHCLQFKINDMHNVAMNDDSLPCMALWTGSVHVASKKATPSYSQCFRACLQSFAESKNSTCSDGLSSNWIWPQARYLAHYLSSLTFISFQELFVVVPNPVESFSVQPVTTFRSVRHYLSRLVTTVGHGHLDIYTPMPTHTTRTYFQNLKIISQ